MQLINTTHYFSIFCENLGVGEFVLLVYLYQVGVKMRLFSGWRQ